MQRVGFVVGPGFPVSLAALAAFESRRGVLAFVRKAAKKSRRIASICTGAFILAEAGLLNGRRATTHWCAARDLRERYPNVNVDEDRIFIAHV